MTRDYEAIAGRTAALVPQSASRKERLLLLTSILWEALAQDGVSWCGFYVPSKNRRELLLECCKPKPACSPIGLHGVCGKAFLTKKPKIVRDVKELGAGYVACDPRDRSEAVIPLICEDGACWAVLDLDSHETGAFTRDDAEGLARVLFAAGLSVPAKCANHE